MILEWNNLVMVDYFVYKYSKVSLIFLLKIWREGHCSFNSIRVIYVSLTTLKGLLTHILQSLSFSVGQRLCT